MTDPTVVLRYGRGALPAAALNGLIREENTALRAAPDFESQVAEAGIDVSQLGDLPPVEEATSALDPTVQELIIAFGQGGAGAAGAAFFKYMILPRLRRRGDDVIGDERSDDDD